MGDRWHVDETYVKVAGTWRYLYRALDQFGQVIDRYLSVRRDAPSARRFFTKALASAQTKPTEVVTDGYRLYPALLGKFVPQAFHDMERYADNAVEADHGRLKARLRPMRGLKQFRSARGIVAGHAFVQNLRRGHYELGVEARASLRAPEASAELALVV